MASVGSCYRPPTRPLACSPAGACVFVWAQFPRPEKLSCYFSVSLLAANAHSFTASENVNLLLSFLVQSLSSSFLSAS